MSTTTTTFAVSGMTCGHCVAAVTEEVSGLAGVSRVDVELVAGGDSLVTVTSERALPSEEVRAAVEEAGYELSGGG
jgi:copper chaperone